MEGVLETLNGTALNCWEESSSRITGNTPPSRGPRCRFAAGATITLSAGITSHTACPLSRVPPGRYEGRLIVKLPILEGTQARVLSQEVEIPVDIQTPTGQDAACLKALEEAAAKASKPGHRTRPLPFLWREVFQVHRFPADQIILTRFPTSTYAGYALRERVPALAREALTDLNDPDGTLRRWGDRGGGQANIQAHIAKVQKSMRAYAKVAGPFLQAHPNFAYAAEIRRGYAMCLGLTGHMPEAMTELNILSEGKGETAEEAKTYLGTKPRPEME